MPATSPGGFPYVLPSDHPLEYPAASQQLTNALDASRVKLDTVGGSAVTLSLAFQTAATIAAASGGNTFKKPALAFAVYHVLAVMPANIGWQAQLEVRDAANATTLASMLTRLQNGSAANAELSMTVVVPYVMAAETQYVIRAQVSNIGSTAGGTVSGDQTRHRLWIARIAA